MNKTNTSCIEHVQQLRVFATVAQYLSFTRAAQALYLTQSAVSHQIAALERAFDTPLFVREGRRVTLTDAGQTLVQHTARIFSVLDEAVTAVQQKARPDAGALRIGASPTACEFIIPESLREFRESYPGYAVTISVADSPLLIDRLLEGSIDLAIMIRTDQQRRLQFHQLFKDQLGFLVSPNHPWASKDRIEPRDILGQQFVLYTRTSATHRLIERHLARMQVSIGSFTELGSMSAIKELLKLGLGVSIAAPWVAAAEIRERSLVWIRMPRRSLERTWVLASRNGRRLTIAEQTFLGLCRATAENMILRTGQHNH